MKLPNRSRLSSVVGLNLSDGQLRASQVVRAKGGLETAKSASAPLSLDVLHPDTELVGREIKNLLEAAGIRERHCVVTLPARWVMSHPVKIPELSSEDSASYLQLEAEKGFPVDAAQLQLAQSFQRSSGGTYVTQLAVRSEQLTQLTAALKSAGMKPLSYSLGLTVLPGAVGASGGGRITVAVDSAGVTLLVAAGGGVVSFRTCEASIQTEAGEKLVNGAAVARELRISFEQVPAELRDDVRQLYLIGEPTLVQQLGDALRDWAKAAGLTLETGNPSGGDLAALMAQQLAARWLETGAAVLEFLPPRPSRWTRLMARYNGKRLAAAGFAVGAAAVLAVAAFGWQEYRRWSLSSQWSAMQAQVTGLQSVQSRILQYRPFYDNSFRTLTILKRVTESFPENGSVTAKTFEIHNTAIVSITGIARDHSALLRTQDELRKVKQVEGLKVEQIRGKTPMQFTFTFRWNANSGT